MHPPTANPPTFQQLILRLQTFWADHGCVLQQPYDVEVGAGTMAPETFLRVLGPKPYRVAYVQPSRRPADGRYGENPNRLFKHMQLQVILKPPPENVQELYLESLAAIGIDLRQHDIKFEEDNWEAPTLSAWGVGWQVMLDGLEITQFTYFQQCGGVDLFPISAELTYGLERICAFLQDVDSIYDIVWARDPETGSVVKYGDVRLADELQFSVYNFEAADVEKTWKHFELCEAECKSLLYIKFSFSTIDDSTIDCSWSSFSVGTSSQRCVSIVGGTRRIGGLHSGKIFEVTPVLDGATREVKFEEGRPKAQSGQLILSKRPLGVATSFGSAADFLEPVPSPVSVLGAYDLCLKCSHLFNILDARGAISVTERVGVIARVRALAVGIAKAWVDQQKSELAASPKKSDDPEPARDKKPRRETLSPVG
ncbi:MAG TPA: glycine--tRNA ligase subunit alpha [Candidatus Sulfotelmatobacter sp.]